MAHELLDETMFYVGETPWHKLGVKLPNPPTIEEALVHGNLDWEVRKVPTYYSAQTQFGMSTYRISAEMPTGHFVTIRQDLTGNWYPLGHVSERYEVLQNADAFEPFKVLLDHGYTLETAGAIDNGKRVWILAKKPSSHMVGDDKLLQYAVLMNSHDGSTPVFLQPTDVRVVCKNTLDWALDGNKAMRFSIKHTTGVGERLKEVSKILDKADANWAKAHDIMNMMHDHKIDEKQAEVYFEAVIPFLRNRGMSGTNKLGVEHRDFATPVFEQLKQNFKFGAGNKGETLWDAYNAVTEYYDHQKTYKNWIKNTQFGKAAEYKRNAFKYASRIVLDKEVLEAYA